MHNYSSRRSLCSRSRYNLISLGTLHEEGFNFSSEGDLIEVFKEAHVKFQADHVGNVYVLRNSEVTVIQGFEIESCGTIIDYDGFEFGCSVLPKRRLGLGGVGVQQETPDCYSYGGENSHKSCVNQGDRWVIKFRLGLNLFDLIKL